MTTITTSYIKKELRKLYDGKNNKYGILNETIDFGNKLIHFAGVGSGMSFYNNKDNKTVESYMNWAKSQYVIYQKLFLFHPHSENFPALYIKDLE